MAYNDAIALDSDVFKNCNSIERSRFGRVRFPPLAHWTGERIFAPLNSSPAYIPPKQDEHDCDVHLKASSFQEILMGGSVSTEKKVKGLVGKENKVKKQKEAEKLKSVFSKGNDVLESSISPKNKKSSKDVLNVKVKTSKTKKKTLKVKNKPKEEKQINKNSSVRTIVDDDDENQTAASKFLNVKETLSKKKTSKINRRALKVKEKTSQVKKRKISEVNQQTLRRRQTNRSGSMKIISDSSDHEETEMPEDIEKNDGRADLNSNSLPKSNPDVKSSKDNLNVKKKALKKKQTDNSSVRTISDSDEETITSKDVIEKEIVSGVILDSDNLSESESELSSGEDVLDVKETLSKKRASKVKKTSEVKQRILRERQTNKKRSMKMISDFDDHSKTEMSEDIEKNDDRAELNSNTTLKISPNVKSSKNNVLSVKKKVITEKQTDENSIMEISDSDSVEQLVTTKYTIQEHDDCVVLNSVDSSENESEVASVGGDILDRKKTVSKKKTKEVDKKALKVQEKNSQVKKKKKKKISRVKEQTLKERQTNKNRPVRMFSNSNNNEQTKISEDIEQNGETNELNFNTSPKNNSNGKSAKDDSLSTSVRKLSLMEKQTDKNKSVKTIADLDTHDSGNITNEIPEIDTLFLELFANSKCSFGEKSNGVSVDSQLKNCSPESCSSSNSSNVRTVKSLYKRKLRNKNVGEITTCCIADLFAESDSVLESSPFLSSGLPLEPAIVNNKKSASKKDRTNALPKRMTVSPQHTAPLVVDKISKKYSKSCHNIKKRQYNKRDRSVKKEKLEVNIKAKKPRKSVPAKRASQSKAKNIPKKGTLKRKKWVVEKLNELNQGHNDDLFAGTEIAKMKPFVKNIDTTVNNSTINLNFATPKMPSYPKMTVVLTPEKEHLSSPEFNINRKIADDYLYRREKRNKAKAADNETDEKEKSMQVCSQEEIEKVMENAGDVLTKLQTRQLRNAEKESEFLSDEDVGNYYFSDSEGEENELVKLKDFPAGSKVGTEMKKAVQNVNDMLRRTGMSKYGRLLE